MGFIVIDYDTLILVTVFAFAAIGLSRGWLTEFINTILLVIVNCRIFASRRVEIDIGWLELAQPAITSFNFHTNPI